jgi:hypothetical protein
MDCESLWKTFESSVAEARRVAASLVPLPELAAGARALLRSDDVQELARRAGLRAFPPAATPDRKVNRSTDMIVRLAALDGAAAVAEEVERRLRALLLECIDMRERRDACVAAATKRSDAGEFQGRERFIFESPFAISRLKHVYKRGRRVLLACPIFEMEECDVLYVFSDIFNHAMFSYFLTKCPPDVAACSVMQFSIGAAFAQYKGEWVPMLVSECEYAGPRNGTFASVAIAAEEATGSAARDPIECLDADARMGDAEMCKRLLLVHAQIAAVAMFHSVCSLSHGDLHQSNLIVGDDFSVRVIDFDMSGRQGCTQYLESADVRECPVTAEGPSDYVIHAELFASGLDASVGSENRGRGAFACAPLQRHSDVVMLINEMPWRAFDRDVRMPLPGFLMQQWNSDRARTDAVGRALYRLAVLAVLVNCPVFDSSDGASVLFGPSFLFPMLFAAAPVWSTWHLANTAAAMAQATCFPFANEDAVLDFLTASGTGAQPPLDSPRALALAAMRRMMYNFLCGMAIEDAIQSVFSNICQEGASAWMDRARQEWGARGERPVKTVRLGRKRVVLPNSACGATIVIDGVLSEHGEIKPAGEATRTQVQRKHGSDAPSAAFLAALSAICAAHMDKKVFAHVGGDPLAMMQTIGAARREFESYSFRIQRAALMIVDADRSFLEKTTPVERLFLGVHTINDVRQIHHMLKRWID